KNQKAFLLINAPSAFDVHLTELVDVQVFQHVEETNKVEFALIFVTTKKEIEQFAQLLAGKALGDAVIWFSYPKMSSKKYSSEINRDSGWQALTDLGYKPVRQVAIDQDWSALRFRQERFVGS
ncbi:MAG: hypothetical protein ACK2TV_15315, partial [Anaerolineales bacterium]